MLAGDRQNSPGQENAETRRAQNYRFVHETSLYETASGLYPVLLGLILTDSLKSMAEDIVNRPLSGDWSLRFLTCALLALAALWLHVWIASFRQFIIKASPDERHDSLPGAKFEHVQGYGPAIASFWLGIVQLIIFTCMAYSVDSEAKFFAGSIAYSITIVLYEFSAVGHSDMETRQERAEAWRKPWHAVASLWRDRFLPLSQSDRDRYLQAEGRQQRILIEQARVFDSIMALVVTLTSISLIIAVHLFGASWWIALIGLIGMISAMIMDYLMYPYFYGN